MSAGDSAGSSAVWQQLGLYKPRQWSAQDTAIDVIDKLLQAEATSVIYDHVIARNGTSDATAG